MEWMWREPCIWSDRAARGRRRSEWAPRVRRRGLRLCLLPAALVAKKLSLRDVLRSLKGKKEFAWFRFDDPLPFYWCRSAWPASSWLWSTSRAYRSRHWSTTRPRIF